MTWVLLLRGINVNPSTRLAMADLRGILESEGLTDVRTILQSGNVLAESGSRPKAKQLATAITGESGVKTSVVVVAQADFRSIAKANPLRQAGDDLSKMVITFLDPDIVPGDIERPTADELAPERLHLTPRAIYQWCPDGILKSKLPPSFWRQFGSVTTTRNVRTVERILAALR